VSNESSPEKINLLLNITQGLGLGEGKRPLGTSRHMREDNIKMDLRQIGCVGLDWIHLAQNGDQWRALVNTVMSFRFL
jgi:hypothetical protein